MQQGPPRRVYVLIVGHHGSRNATPRELLWESATERQSRKLLTTFSNMPGSGSAAATTEVPLRSSVRASETGITRTTTTQLRQLAIAQPVDIDV